MSPFLAPRPDYLLVASPAVQTSSALVDGPWADSAKLELAEPDWSNDKRAQREVSRERRKVGSRGPSSMVSRAEVFHLKLPHAGGEGGQAFAERQPHLSGLVHFFGHKLARIHLQHYSVCRET